MKQTESFHFQQCLEGWRGGREDTDGHTRRLVKAGASSDFICTFLRRVRAMCCGRPRLRGPVFNGACWVLPTLKTYYLERIIQDRKSEIRSNPEKSRTSHFIFWRLRDPNIGFHDKKIFYIKTFLRLHIFFGGPHLWHTKFPGQGLNLCHSSGLRHSDNARSLINRAPRNSLKIVFIFL